MSKNFVENLTLEEKVEILENYKELNSKGMIGDCLLRDKADEFSNEQTPILRMQILASNVAFDMAYKYVDFVNDDLNKNIELNDR